MKPQKTKELLEEAKQKFATLFIREREEGTVPKIGSRKCQLLI